MLFDLAVAGGYKSKNMDPDVIIKLTRFSFDTFGKDLMQGRNFQQFLDECYAIDKYEEMADNLVGVHTCICLPCPRLASREADLVM